MARRVRPVRAPTALGRTRLSCPDAHISTGTGPASSPPDQVLKPEPLRDAAWNISAPSTVAASRIRLPPLSASSNRRSCSGAHGGHVDLPGDCRDHDAAFTADRDGQSVTHDQPPINRRQACLGRRPGRSRSSPGKQAGAGCSYFPPVPSSCRLRTRSGCRRRNATTRAGEPCLADWMSPSRSAPITPQNSGGGADVAGLLRRGSARGYEHDPAEHLVGFHLLVSYPGRGSRTGAPAAAMI
jgi:hypothetical protein